ncbi:hypothetical protein Tco_1544056, partial [Tanacetum coccineum]
MTFSPLSTGVRPPATTAAAGKVSGQLSGRALKLSPPPDLSDLLPHSPLRATTTSQLTTAATTTTSPQLPPSPCHHHQGCVGLWVHSQGVRRVGGNNQGVRRVVGSQPR